MIGGLTHVSLCDIGLHRAENQDFIGHDLTAHGLLFIVADGMGGHAGGGVASQLAVNTIKKSLRSLDSKPSSAALKAAIEIANHTIWDIASHRLDLRGMGSTVVSLLIQSETAFFAHVGDSRIYLLRDNHLHLMTRDHTLVQSLVDSGAIEPDEAETHQDAHKLNRSLGSFEWVSVEQPEAPVQLMSGDIFLLCSDGLTGLLKDFEIGQILRDNDLHDAVRLLVDEANARGGFDNTSVSAVRIDSLPVSFSAIKATSTAQVVDSEPVSPVEADAAVLRSEEDSAPADVEEPLADAAHEGPASVRFSGEDVVESPSIEPESPAEEISELGVQGEDVDLSQASEQDEEPAAIESVVPSTVIGESYRDDDRLAAVTSFRVTKLEGLSPVALVNKAFPIKRLQRPQPAPGSSILITVFSFGAIIGVLLGLLLATLLD